jgi:hypothetical protein
MKKAIILSLMFLGAFIHKGNSQDSTGFSHEKFGNTFNLGAGVGYYGYVGHPLPVAMLNYEFDVARNFTLAPFAGFYSYQNHYYWGNPDKPGDDASYRLYSYRVTAVPAGLKGTYYFDELLHANPKWDFYAAGSVGFVFRTVSWESGYYGDTHAYQNGKPLYLDAHAGAEYHMTPKAGIFLDLSPGVSTLGFALHF